MIKYTVLEDSITIRNTQRDVASEIIETINIYKDDNEEIYYSLFKYIFENRDNLDWGKIQEITTEKEKTLLEYGRFKLTTKHLTIDEKEFNSKSNFVQHLRGMVHEGKNVDRFLKMLERIELNPYEDVYYAFFLWLEKVNPVITEEGKVLGYKSVTPDFKDWHTNTIDNKVGTQVPPLKHWECDRDSFVECSMGYHIGTYQYALSFYGGRNITINEFDPRDIIVIPKESSWGKIRVLTYKVVATHEGNELPTNLTTYSGETISKDKLFMENKLKVEDDYTFKGDEYRDEYYDEFEEDEFCPECGDTYDWCSCDDDDYDEYDL